MISCVITGGICFVAGAVYASIGFDRWKLFGKWVMEKLFAAWRHLR